MPRSREHGPKIGRLFQWNHGTKKPFQGRNGFSVKTSKVFPAYALRRRMNANDAPSSPSKAEEASGITATLSIRK